MPNPHPLKNGSFYIFTPSLTADAKPQGMGDVLPNQEFSRGWFLDFQDGHYIFLGKPHDSEHSYFFCLPAAEVGRAVLDPNQVV